MKTSEQISREADFYEAFNNARLCLSIFEDMGRPIDKRSRILDFGCGQGWMVYALRTLGYNAVGADIEPSSSRVEELLGREGLAASASPVLSRIDACDQKIPFDNDHFDVVVSWDVMEHVQDHARTLAEIRRVLRPGGESLHYFPSKYRPIESHTSVPLGTVVQFQAYLYLCALIGFKNADDKGLPAHQVARNNYRFLKDHTNYLTRRQILRLVETYFTNVEFVEEHACKYNPGGKGLVERLLCRWSSGLIGPIAIGLLSACGRRAVYFVKPADGSDCFSQGAVGAS